MPPPGGDSFFYGRCRWIHSAGGGGNPARAQSTIGSAGPRHNTVLGLYHERAEGVTFEVMGKISARR